MERVEVPKAEEVKKSDSGNDNDDPEQAIHPSILDQS